MADEYAKSFKQIVDKATSGIEAAKIARQLRKNFLSKQVCRYPRASEKIFEIRRFVLDNLTVPQQEYRTNTAGFSPPNYLSDLKFKALAAADNFETQASIAANESAHNKRWCSYQTI